MSKKKIILVEGKTEQHLLTHLNISEQLFCKISRFNLWENDINKIIVQLTRGAIIYIIYDIDTLFSSNLNKQTIGERFINNINTLLTTYKRTIILLQQTHNFEDELAYACTSEKALLKEFNACNRQEFKKQFLTTRNPLDKLKKIKFNQSNLWTKEMAQELAIFQKYQGSWKKLKKR